MGNQKFRTTDAVIHNRKTRNARRTKTWSYGRIEKQESGPHTRLHRCVPVGGLTPIRPHDVCSGTKATGILVCSSSQFDGFSCKRRASHHVNSAKVLSLHIGKAKGTRSFWLAKYGVARSEVFFTTNEPRHKSLTTTYTMKIPVLPSRSTAAKLFLTGATVGPIVDSIHNQCLLRYDLAPITLAWPDEVGNHFGREYLFCSSWAIPPLLGFAYIVLGGIVPRAFQQGIDRISSGPSQQPLSTSSSAATTTGKTGRNVVVIKAVAAVLTTAMIIELSQFLETSQPFLHVSGDDDGVGPMGNLGVMLAAALVQWALLDGTAAALLSASLVSIGGPLSELPFVAHGFWHYLPQAGDYLPLANLGGVDLDTNQLWTMVMGTNYRELALSSITGPCYFAVTMDAIALGRWFDSVATDETNAN